MESMPPLRYPTLEAGQELDKFGLPPRPEKAPILEIVPQKTLASALLLRSKLIDDTTIRAWSVCTPVSRGVADKLTWGGLGGLLGSFASLSETVWIEESYPDFMPAIDLNTLSGGANDVLSIFATFLEVADGGIYRVCIGCEGDGAAARMWIGEQAVSHGELVQLRSGTYAVVILSTTGTRRFGGWQWQGRVLAPRLTKVEPHEIEDAHTWEVERWQCIRDAKINYAPDTLFDSVEFDKNTVRGKEGFYSVGRSTDGHWWFIDPDGNPFFYRGMCALNQGGAGGRRMGKPPIENERVVQWIETLRTWGFNALGAWTTSEFFDKGMPYTEVIETFFVEPWLAPSFPDVFDPLWESTLDEKCRYICAPLRQSRDLVGYFLDNERGFRESLRCDQCITRSSPTYVRSQEQKGSAVINPAVPEINPEGMGLLQWLLSVEEDRPGVLKAREFAMARYGSFEALGRAWGVPLSDRQSLVNLGIRGEILISAGYLRDEAEFLRIWIDRYFEIAVGAIRRYDPNHLILGCRWGGLPGPVTLEIEKRWVDVISQNSYQAEMMERLDLTCEVTGLPLLVGESSATTDAMCHERGPIEPPGGHKHWRTRQAIRTFDGWSRLARHPGIVGYTIYKWNGQRPTQADLECVGRVNVLAERFARTWQGVSAQPTGPLHGSIYIALCQAAPKDDLLPGTDSSIPPNVRRTFEHLYLGLICHEGTWGSRIHGNGLTGVATTRAWDGVKAVIDLEVRMIPGMFTFRTGIAGYHVELRRSGDVLNGSYRGNYNGVEVVGKVIAYVHRAVSSFRL